VARKLAGKLGRCGGLKGGKVRAEKLSDERKSEIARNAAKARWGTSGGVSGSRKRNLLRTSL
jgi:hypothetical protein